MRLTLLALCATFVACNSATPDIKDGDGGENGEDNAADSGTDNGGDTAADSGSSDSGSSDSGSSDSGSSDSGSSDSGSGDSGSGDSGSGDALQGRAWAFYFADANVTDPPGIGGILGSYITTPVMVGVVSSSGSSLTMRGALGIEGTDPVEQDECVPTFAFPEADFSRAPAFSVGPTNTTLDVSGNAVTVEDLEITGTFSADGSTINHMTFSGLVDTRPLDSLIGGGEGATCDLLGNFGVSCQTCASDGEAFCITFAADSITADEAVGPLIEINSGC